MFNSLFRACLALIAALGIGRSSESFCPLFWWLASCRSSGWTRVSLCSAHSRGYRKLSVRFSNFPDAVRTVAPFISPSHTSTLEMSSSTAANLQVPSGELSFRSATSPLVGWDEDCALGA